MTIAIPYDNRLYKVEGDMMLVLEVEEELGPLPLLREKFMTGRWAVTDLVSLMHILLSRTGRSIDFCALGTHMLEQGLGRYHKIAEGWLQSMLTPMPSPGHGRAGADGGADS